jgi:hypothetical protein
MALTMLHPLIEVDPRNLSPQPGRRLTFLVLGFIPFLRLAASAIDRNHFF